MKQREASDGAGKRVALRVSEVCFFCLGSEDASVQYD